jgi:hypothetical protein
MKYVHNQRYKEEKAKPVPDQRKYNFSQQVESKDY